MPKYFCEFCNRTLLNDKLRSRRMHANGARHALMRKAYYMEVFEEEDVAAELDSILRDIPDRRHEDTGGDHEQDTVSDFKLPPCVFPSTFSVPEEPAGFKLPVGFDFGDRRNFPEDIGEAVRRYT